MTDEQMADFMTNQLNRQSEWRELYAKQQKDKAIRRAEERYESHKEASKKWRQSIGVRVGTRGRPSNAFKQTLSLCEPNA